MGVYDKSTLWTSGAGFWFRLLATAQSQKPSFKGGDGGGSREKECRRFTKP